MQELEDGEGEAEEVGGGEGEGAGGGEVDQANEQLARDVEDILS